MILRLAEEGEETFPVAGKEKGGLERETEEEAEIRPRMEFTARVGSILRGLLPHC